MKDERSAVYKNIYEMYSDRLAQIDILHIINRFFGAGAITLAFLTDKPGLWLGLGVAVADAVINDFQLRRRSREAVDQYQETKNSVSQALAAEKNR